MILSIGLPSLAAEGLEAAALGPRVVPFGGTPTDAPKAGFYQNLVHYREVELVGCEGVGVVGPVDAKRAYRLALRLMSTGQAPLEQLITHRFSLEDLHQAMAVAQSREGLKVILFPWGVPDQQ